MSTYTVAEVRPFVGKPKVIVECGCCNGEDTLDLLATYKPERLITFEANPENIVMCQRRLVGTPIELVEEAVSDVTGTLQFYPGDIQGCANPNGGISSVYPFKAGYEQFKLQQAVTVPSTRLDDFMTRANLHRIDLLCMDIQGAELLALHGLGERIQTVRTIITEVWFKPYYDGAPTLTQIEQYLSKYGFTRKWLYSFTDFGDALFTRA